VPRLEGGATSTMPEVSAAESADACAEADDGHHNRDPCDHHWRTRTAVIEGDDPYERAAHAYGRSYRDVVRAFRGRFDNPPDVVAAPGPPAAPAAGRGRGAGAGAARARARPRAPAEGALR
jgi:hypothetical protein